MLKEYAISILLIATMTAPSLASGFDSKTSLRCYSEPSGPKYQICDKSFGFQTCFTKYDDSQKIVLRGCSSKRKMFHIECESHLSGTRSEQFCYCSYDLCNERNTAAVKVQLRVLFTLLIFLRTGMVQL